MNHFYKSHLLYNKLDAKEFWVITTMFSLLSCAISTSIQPSSSLITKYSECITFDPVQRLISVLCKSANLTNIYKSLSNKDPTPLKKEYHPHSRIWILNANLTLARGATLYINSTDTDWLKINSTGEVAYDMVSYGNLMIDSVKITSWDSSKNDFATTKNHGVKSRSYIFVNSGIGETSNITNSEIAYLGYADSHAFGLVYYGGAGSIIKDNKIHDLWYGFYSQNRAHNITIENNEIYNNTEYGINPHNTSHELKIRNNIVYDNGKHGIICSSSGYRITLDSNIVYNNGQDGIKLYNNVSKSTIRNNKVYNNTDDQISIYGSQHNNIYKNSVSKGKSGLRISNSSDNEISNNAITTSSLYGIYILRGAHNNFVSSNQISKAAVSAIHIQDQKTIDNILIGNYLLNSTRDAVSLYNSNVSNNAFFISNHIKGTNGHDYSLDNSTLNLIDTNLNGLSIHPKYNSDKVNVEYSQLSVLRGLAKELSLLPQHKIFATTTSDSSVDYLKKLLFSSFSSLLLFANVHPSLLSTKFQIPYFYFFPAQKFTLNLSSLNSNQISGYSRNPFVKSDPHLKIENVFEGINFPTAMAFLNANDILVLEKNNGALKRIMSGKMMSYPLADLAVANNGERGLLGIEVSKGNGSNTESENNNHNININNTANTKGSFYNIFLYYTQAGKPPGSDNQKDGNDLSKNITPTGNMLYRFELKNNTNRLLNPKLLLTIPATPGPFHNGGALKIGPDSNLYVAVGDIFGRKTKSENYINGSDVDSSGGILRITQDGKAVNQAHLGTRFPLSLYYAYGIRNSFGMDFDPLTGNLWDTENGPTFGDEINLVTPGFNSGWRQIQGIWRPNGDLEGNIVLHPEDQLESFNGRGIYHQPKFIWNGTVGLTGLVFFNSDKLGKQYTDNMFVGDFLNGNIYRFKLNSNRTELLSPSGKALSHYIVNNSRDFANTDMLFAGGFGGIVDIKAGPDGYLYILAVHNTGASCDKRHQNMICLHYNYPNEGSIYRIVPVDK